jgi:2-phospho-L-lactate/phosphoenolpyruvate guanylyltransferase
MTWLAVIPLKGTGERKTRLAGRLDKDQRRLLSRQLFEHVAAVLRESVAISEIALLSDLHPPEWQERFFPDGGGGLNAELASLAGSIGPQPLLVIHADLPLLTTEDISLLLAEGEGGCAIAPDRKGSGTNALALRDPSGFEFLFGPESCGRHLAASEGRTRVVRRLGLGLDVDTPEDLDAAIALGFSPY